MKRFTYYFLLVIFCLIASKSAYCQLNIQIGYSISHLPFTTINASLEDFNRLNNRVEHPFNSLRFLNGFIVGLQFPQEHFIWGAHWTYRLNSLYSKGLDSVTQPFIEQKLNFSWQSIGINLEYRANGFGIGATGDYDLVNMAFHPNSNGDKEVLIDDSGISSKIYLSYYLPTKGRLGLILQPFFQRQWSTTNLSKLSEWARPPGTRGRENLQQWGISLLFNNGSQLNN